MKLRVVFILIFSFFTSFFAYSVKGKGLSQEEFEKKISRYRRMRKPVFRKVKGKHLKNQNSFKSFFLRDKYEAYSLRLALQGAKKDFDAETEMQIQKWKHRNEALNKLETAPPNGSQRFESNSGSKEGCPLGCSFLEEKSDLDDFWKCKYCKREIFPSTVLPIKV